MSNVVDFPKTHKRTMKAEQVAKMMSHSFLGEYEFQRLVNMVYYAQADYCHRTYDVAERSAIFNGLAHASWLAIPNNSRMADVNKG